MRRPVRPRTELGLAIALGILVLTAIGIHAFSANEVRALDHRRSSYLATPTGSRGWIDALDRLGVTTVRWRHRFPREPAPSAPRPALFAVTDPAVPISPFDARELVQWNRRWGDLLLAGEGTAQAMRCYGWEVVPLALPDGTPGPRASGVVGGHRIALAAVDAGLRYVPEGAVGDSLPSSAFGTTGCGRARARATDTLIATPSGMPVVVRVRGDSGRATTLVADGALFSNRMLRTTDAGILALALVVPKYRAVYVDEFHQGHTSGGSLTAAVLAWGRESPWGWGLWQLAVVGVLALAAAAVRFGPVIPDGSGRRRSPIEHARALGTALAAARGHDVAARLMVQGLRRRLSRDSRTSRASVGEWLADLGARVRTPRARSAVRDLQQLITPPQPADAVLRAAIAVEDVWQELRP